jgi:hypothetical protein
MIQELVSRQLVTAAWEQGMVHQDSKACRDTMGRMECKTDTEEEEDTDEHLSSSNYLQMLEPPLPL